MKPTKVYLTEEALTAIDEARGNRSRSEYVGSAAVEQARRDAARKEAAEKAAKEQG